MTASLWTCGVSAWVGKGVGGGMRKKSMRMGITASVCGVRVKGCKEELVAWKVRV